MAIGWGAQRKILYFSAVTIIGGLILLILYFNFFVVAPSCFDGRQNGDETGVDCGGSCTLLCSNQAHAPSVLWARAFLVASSTYTVAAYVQNTNAGAGAKNVHYTFQLFDAKNSLITEQSGIIDLPPAQVIPIIETGITTGQRTVARTLFSFSDIPVWNKVPATALPALSISSENLSADGTRLSATITNNSFENVMNLTAAAVIFNTDNVAVAASKSLMKNLAQKSSQEVVFTWPNSTLNISHAEIILLPAF